MRLGVRYKQLNGDLITSSDLVDLTNSQILEITSGEQKEAVYHGEEEDLSRSNDSLYSGASSFFVLIKRITGLDYKKNLSMRITEIGLDSVGFVHLRNEIEQKLGVSIPFPFLYQATFQELENFVLKEKLDSSEKQIDWEKEISMTGYDIVNEKKAESELHDGATVLLTGANGFLGVYLLRELVQRNYKVCCIIRGDGKEKLANSMKYHKLEFSLENVSLLEGDLSKKNFGLSHDEFSKLATHVDLVIHNGCYVNGLYPYSMLKDVNVNSTKDCIALCSHKNAKLVYVSSLSSLLPGEKEENVVLQFREAMNYMGGYGQSKRVSEMLVQRFHKNHLIVRPGTIGPSLVTGSCNLNDTITKFVVGIAELGKAPTLKNEWITVVPVDMCSVIICDMMKTNRSGVNVFGERVAVEELTKTVAKYYPLEHIAFVDFVQFLLKSETECALSPLKDYFKNYQFPLQDDGKVANRSGYECRQEADFTKMLQFLQNK